MSKADNKCESENGFLLVWSIKNDWRKSEGITDHYAFCVERDEATKEYNKLLEKDNLYSASICAVVESTDYATSKQIYHHRTKYVKQEVDVKEAIKEVNDE